MGWRRKKLNRAYFAAVEDQFQCAKVQSILVPPHFVCSGDGTRQIVILKTKIKLVSINVAINGITVNISYDTMMQCLDCLRYVHDRVTLLICRQMISC